MSERSQCPDHEALRRWNSGTLSQEQFESVADHLEACSACQASLDQLAAPSFVLDQHIAGVTASDLERARVAIEADTPTVQAVSSWIAELQSQSPESFEPSLKVPCELRQYEVLALLGHGGMGEVYHARHKRLKRDVALKVMRSHRQEDPVAQSHFLREIETAGQLDHPNLVRAYDAWEQDGYVFLTQERLDGDSLGRLASQGKIGSASEVLDYLTGICHGLEELHARGFLHRDIKPSNIMRLRDGTIKLIDYGLAVPTDSGDSSTHLRAGTIGYMAPEQASGEGTLDQRSDIYSVGCVLKYLLRHLPVDAPDEHDAQLRFELGGIAEQMTQTRPEARPASIAAMLHRLELLTGPNAASSEQDLSPYRTVWSAGLLGAILLIAPLCYWLGTRPNPESIATSAGSDTAIQPAPPPFQLAMVDIPAGRFVMGGVDGDPLLRTNEFPQRTITFHQPFQISATEVTVGQFREFVRATGYVTFAESSGQGGWMAGRATSYGQRKQEFNWANPGYPTADDLPVTMVTYQDAVAFCEWLSQREGGHYRLPTEAEWEYCCRAGSREFYGFPRQFIDDHVWYLSNVGPSLTPRPVGTRQPNAWKLHDMAGNVREWCLDWYSDVTYRSDAESHPVGPETGTLRVIRGGSFMDVDAFFRASFRGSMEPKQVLGNQGFRVVTSDVVHRNKQPAPDHEPKNATALRSSTDRENSKKAQSPVRLEWIDVPAGQFVMGGVNGDATARTNELPQRTVVFAEPFRISAYEITVGQFREFVAVTQYKTEGELSGQGGWLPSRASSFGSQKPEFIWSSPGYMVSDELPVTMVSYGDAVEFCRWMSQRDQRNYRLPTEAEWEYCCRAGTKGVHAFPIEELNDSIWSLHNVGRNLAPRPVGTRRENAWGIHDMVGNVREWCSDWYSETAYQSDPAEFPRGPESGESRVIRGGSYMDVSAFFRSSHRGNMAPSMVVGNLGFRVVEVPQKGESKVD